MESLAEDKLPELGPQTPPEFDDEEVEEEKNIYEKKWENHPALEKKATGFVEDKNESELKTSIKKRGANSYYYAHDYGDVDKSQAKQFYGNGIIYGGEPKLLEKKDATEEAAEKKGPSMIAI